MSEPLWIDAPPPVSNFVPIFTPRGPGGRVEAVILSHATTGILVHFVNNRTVPCTAVRREDGSINPRTCPLCVPNLSRRWRGYLGVQECRTGRIGILELTTYAVQHCTVLCTSAETLRGKRIRLVRQGQRRQGHVVATIEECVGPDHPDLPACPDVCGTLRRIWFGGYLDKEEEIRGDFGD